MTFAFAGAEPTGALAWFAEGLRGHLRSHGLEERPGEEARLVVNLITAGDPRPYRRRAQATYVVSVLEAALPADDLLRAAYPFLVRSLSNLLIVLVPVAGGHATYAVTLEQGTYAVWSGPGHGDGYFRRVYERIEPLATSNLIINNIFRPDLEEELWDGDELTRGLQDAGRRLDELNLLPAAFPIQDLLSERDLRHVQRLYHLGGLSYGNLSARKDARRFWMSASGVNKARLETVGRDILMVVDYVPEQAAIVVSVPPDVEPRRVSVDAIEHWMIYREHPSVGAIVHVHAWMDGIRSTQVNYPCGTIELATAVADLVRRADDPSHAVVGLRNHGLTITGPSLAEIFARIEGRIIAQVPMS